MTTAVLFASRPVTGNHGGQDHQGIEGELRMRHLAQLFIDFDPLFSTKGDQHVASIIWRVTAALRQGSEVI